MELHGGNGMFGTGMVELSDRRWVMPLEKVVPAFPRGVGGLLPVVTVRKDGSERTVYAFPCEDGPIERPNIAAEGAALASDEAADVVGEPAVAGDAAAEPAELASASDSAPELPPVLAALLDAVEFVNKMLVQAATLSGYPFGRLGGIQTGIAAAGWGFTRVDIVPLDAHGQKSPSPLHLNIETVDEPGCPDSFSAVVEYDAEGKPAHLTMTEYADDGFMVRVDANTNEKTGKFSVRKVERISMATRNKSLLYKRGKVADRDGYAKGKRPDSRPSGGRPGGRGGWSGGRGGRPGGGRPGGGRSDGGRPSGGRPGGGRNQGGRGGWGDRREGRARGDR